MAVNIPAIAGLDPKVAKFLSPIKQAIEELYSGAGRAVRVTDLGTGFNVARDGAITPDFATIVLPSVQPTLDEHFQQLEAVRSDVSTLSEELLGVSRFGALIGARVSDVKTLKVNVNGHIAGYGVAVYGGAEGEITSDFIIQADRFSVVFPSPEWLPTHAYTLGQYVTATLGAGIGNVLFKVTTAGTTGGTEPTWDATIGHTTSSGSVVFTATSIAARVPFVVGTVGGVASVGINGNLLVDGTIAAASIIAGSITTDKLAAAAVTADKIAANLVLSQAIEISSTGYIRSGQSAFDTGTGWWLGANAGTPVFSIGNSGGNKLTWNGTVLTVVGSVSGAIDGASITGTIPPSAFDIAALGWTLSSTFSATDADTVAWTSGTLYTAAGSSYSIASGNTGNMAARTYIFFDLNVSVTALQQTTTAANSVGPGRILVAVAENSSPSAFFQVFGGSGSFGVTSPQIPSFGPLANGDFETGDATGWVADASWAVVTKTLVTGTYGASIATSSTGLRSLPFVAATGDRFLVTCIAQRDGSSLPDSNLALQVRWEDSAGSLVSTSTGVTASSASSAIQFLRTLVTVPASVARARIVISKSGGASGHWFADDVFVTPASKDSDIGLGGATGTIDLATQISGILTTAFAAAGLINANVTINADGTLSGAGSGQASLTSLPGTVNLSTKVSGTLSTSFAAAGLINANVTVNADGTLSGAGGGQASLNSLPGAISAGQINANAVTTAALNAGAVTAAKISAGTITANEIAAATITGNRIAANTIAAANIVALTITAAELAANTITAAKIAAQTITAGQIAANTITGDRIAGQTITASEIAASTITGSRIAAATILGTNIAAGTLTAANIAAGTITANEIAANAITANQLATNSVTATKLAASLIYGGEIVVTTGGLMRSGQTDYNTGIGWFLGFNGGVPKFSIGNPAGNRLLWDGTNLSVNGNVDITQAEVPFTVNWLLGWSAPPTGQMFYRKSGNIVWIRCDDNSFGTSNSGNFGFNNLPGAIIPSSARHIVVSVWNQGVLQPATLTIDPTGNCGVVTYLGGGFAGNGAKGFTQGAVFQYSL